MKRKGFYVFLVCEAAVCLLLSFAHEALPGVFTAVIAFPFEQIGLGLRKLSLSGGMGNALSILLYVAVCLTPIAVLLLSRRKRRLHLEDGLLILLCAVLFAVVYLMINPGMLGTTIKNVAVERIGSIGKVILGSMAYSVLLGYLVLRILRLFFSADTSRLQRYMATLLCALSMLFIYLVFGACFGDLIHSIEALRTGNTGNEQSLGTSYVFLVLQYFIHALPYVMNILVVFAGLRLLDALHCDRYSETAVMAANKLSRLCGSALIIIVTSNIGFNLLQLVFLKVLRVVNTSVQIPLLSIAFVLTALLLAQYIRENKQLKDDNDMFI